MFFFYLILFLINIIQVDSTLPACRQTFGSNTYDLNRLSQFTITGEDTLIYGYAITPCGSVPTSQCGQNSQPFEQGMMACQKRMLGPTPSFESAMGFLDGYGKTPNLEFSENTDGPGKGVIMTMRNARCSGMERLVKVIFICDESVATPTRMEVEEFPVCQFTIRIKAAGACPTGPSPTGPTPPESGGTQGGTIFIIILLVLITVYVGGGVLYNRVHKHQTGLALLPHPNFWLLLFGLFIDGCRFTLNFIRTLSTGRSTYNSV
jgi:hypothetical protein